MFLCLAPGICVPSHERMRDHSDKNDDTDYRVLELSRDAENVDCVIEDPHHGGPDHYPEDTSFAAPQAATAQNGSGNG